MLVEFLRHVDLHEPSSPEMLVRWAFALDTMMQSSLHDEAIVIASAYLENICSEGEADVHAEVLDKTDAFPLFHEYASGWKHGKRNVDASGSATTSGRKLKDHALEGAH